MSKRRVFKPSKNYISTPRNFSRLNDFYLNPVDRKPAEGEDEAVAGAAQVASEGEVEEAGAAEDSEAEGAAGAEAVASAEEAEGVGSVEEEGAVSAEAAAAAEEVGEEEDDDEFPPTFHQK